MPENNERYSMMRGGWFIHNVVEVPRWEVIVKDNFTSFIHGLEEFFDSPVAFKFSPCRRI